jgi:thiol:disulfide interchange protein
VLSLLLVGATALVAYEPVHSYDPARDATQDIVDAVAEASRTNLRVLVEVGGEWCVWCHILDDFWEQQPQVTKFRDDNFILVKVNFSEENKNEETLARYPRNDTYPHFLVLDSIGSFLFLRETGELESGQGHSKRKVLRFLKDWAPAD